MSNTKKRQAEDQLPAKKAKKAKNKKGQEQDDDNLDTELGLNLLFSRMDNQLLADHIAQKTTRFGTDLSTIELSDLTVSGKFNQPCFPTPKYPFHRR